MASFKSGIAIGVLIGAIGAVAINNIDITSAFNNKDEINYSKYESSFFYKNLAPSPSTNYFIETPILNALTEDIKWNLIEDEKEGSFCYEGVFENWTDLDIGKIVFELKLLTADGVILDSSDEDIEDIKPGEKRLVKIKIPYDYQDKESLEDVKFNVVATSRDFKNKPFSKK